MDNYSYKIFVINLDSSNTRWQACKKQLKMESHSLNYIERISAVDGRTLSSTQINQHFDSALNQEQYHKTLTAGEIACYMSHRQTWRKIVTENLDFALVLEDDFLLTGNMQELLETVTKIKQPWHCIKLAEHPIKRKELNGYTLNNFRLVNYDKVPARTCAQVISNAGAKRLLASSKKFGRPVDIDLQHWWEHKLIILGLKPYIFEVNQKTTSDIESISTRKNTQTRHISKLIQQFYFYIKNQQAIKNKLLKSC
ncbi:glycosyltransferase family 25 protein [Paraglaciecola aquimarina]|uniref:Glycosyltransferase family 25 protein n=1 Tax=Paraglaciecola aquimarina TaxID=1235557 RepID=A0ABU3STR7_9ALTE|nr:glycosyltransferase family 25 protein [Paraglaciecola aquimarina]MDU0353394.1 glycosyltransferase family 25 protein [Paraglaciecola aquimarina]